MLKNNLDGKNEQFRKDIIKKIIAYTTLGVDTSRLFPEMVMASNTNDLDEKKLIYFYLSIYAEEYSDVAVMAINTFMKDCQSKDHRVRGLSLKSLCGLKFKGAEQYIMPILKNALYDESAYVRRAAVMGVAKVFYMMPDIKNDLSLMDKLYAMIRDADSTVVVNAIVTLNEVLGEIVLTQKLVMYLLNHLNNFN
jgi:AP-4 complex subunit beta-1